MICTCVRCKQKDWGTQASTLFHDPQSLDLFTSRRFLLVSVTRQFSNFTSILEIKFMVIITISRQKNEAIAMMCKTFYPVHYSLYWKWSFLITCAILLTKKSDVYSESVNHSCSARILFTESINGRIISLFRFKNIQLDYIRIQLFRLPEVSMLLIIIVHL